MSLSNLVRSCAVVLALSAWCAPSAEAQQPIPEGVEVRVAWTHPCTHICNQPAGTAGFRVKVDDIEVAIVDGMTGGTMYEHSLGDQMTLGMHTVAVEAFNRNPCMSPDNCEASVGIEIVTTDAPPAPDSITIIVEVQ